MQHVSGFLKLSVLLTWIMQKLFNWPQFISLRNWKIYFSTFWNGFLHVSSSQRPAHVPIVIATYDVINGAETDGRQATLIGEQHESFVRFRRRLYFSRCPRAMEFDIITFPMTQGVARVGCFCNKTSPTSITCSNCRRDPFWHFWLLIREEYFRLNS